MKVALAQINTTVGAFEKNAETAINAIHHAYEQGADIVLCPETTVSGYMVLDLLFNDRFIEDNVDVLNRIVDSCPDIVAIVGFVEKVGDKLFNTAAVIQNGELLQKVHKRCLPTYDVFDEDRYYTPAENVSPVPVLVGDRKILLGIEICEDMWDESTNNVTDDLAGQGAEVILVISASPFTEGKREVRRNLVTGHARRTSLPVFFCNLVGGQEEVVFDGSSLAADSTGELIAELDPFKEILSIVEISDSESKGTCIEQVEYDSVNESFNAIVLGIRDYVGKTGFKKVLIGLSGGVDSSLVATLAVEALGAKNVTGVSMPSRYSSEHSKQDAEELARNIGIEYKVVPIEKVYSSFLELMLPSLEGNGTGVTGENLQARIRGAILMALSNETGAMLLSTGNKTELALGYATLYGDMAGGLSPISDVSKIRVYELCRHYNEMQKRIVIPESVLSKIPSAELAEGQFDPFDYDVVSPLVDDIIERRLGLADLVNAGYERELVIDIMDMIRVAEYKRRQAPPGLKISTKAFGIGRRMPIINKYREG